MEYNDRKNYLILTSVFFFVGFILYGGLAAYAKESMGFDVNIPLLKNSAWILYGFLGGYLLTSIISGILLFASFIRKRGTAWKILCSVLFMFTLAAIVYSGFFLAIPYGIYNIVKLIKGKPADKQEDCI